MDELQVLNDMFRQFDLQFEIVSQSDNKIIFKSDNGDRCIITIELRKRQHSRHIYVNSLEKCAPYSGTEILEQIVQFGKEMNVDYITLSDKSSIGPFNLYVLEILTTGQSWYNRLGFYSSVHAQEVEFNTFVSQLPFETLMIYRKYLSHIQSFPQIYAEKNTLGNVKYAQSKVVQFSSFLEDFPQFHPEQSIRDILTSIKQQYLFKGSTETLTEEQTESLAALLNYLSLLIYYEGYESHLKRDIHWKKTGGARGKPRRKPRKTKKNRVKSRKTR